MVVTLESCCGWRGRRPRWRNVWCGSIAPRCEVFASDDFREGVRAAVIDKDRNPDWSPPRIEDVTPEMIAPYFAEIGADELMFDRIKKCSKRREIEHDKHRIHRPWQHGRADGGQSGQGRPQGDGFRSGGGLAQTGQGRRCWHRRQRGERREGCGGRHHHAAGGQACALGLDRDHSRDDARAR